MYFILIVEFVKAVWVFVKADVYEWWRPSHIEDAALTVLHNNSQVSCYHIRINVQITIEISFN